MVVAVDLRGLDLERERFAVVAAQEVGDRPALDRHRLDRRHPERAAGRDDLVADLEGLVEATLERERDALAAASVDPQPLEVDLARQPPSLGEVVEREVEATPQPVPPALGRGRKADQEPIAERGRLRGAAGHLGEGLVELAAQDQAAAAEDSSRARVSRPWTDSARRRAAASTRAELSVMPKNASETAYQARLSTRRAGSPIRSASRR